MLEILLQTMRQWQRYARARVVLPLLWNIAEQRWSRYASACLDLPIFFDIDPWGRRILAVGRLRLFQVAQVCNFPAAWTRDMVVCSSALCKRISVIIKACEIPGVTVPVHCARLFGGWTCVPESVRTAASFDFEEFQGFACNWLRNGEACVDDTEGRLEEGP